MHNSNTNNNTKEKDPEQILMGTYKKTPIDTIQRTLDPSALVQQEITMANVLDRLNTRGNPPFYNIDMKQLNGYASVINGPNILYTERSVAFNAMLGQLPYQAPVIVRRRCAIWQNLVGDSSWSSFSRHAK